MIFITKHKRKKATQFFQVYRIETLNKVLIHHIPRKGINTIATTARTIRIKYNANDFVLIFIKK
jgi:hypothetical protein